MPNHCGEPAASQQRLRVLLAAPVHGLGGQAVAAREIAEQFAGHPEVKITVQAVDPRLRGALGFLTARKGIRTVVRPLLYVRGLLRRGLETDVFHVFCAAHFAFLFGALPAILVARLYRLPVVLNYHDGRADAHLRLWGVLVRWALRSAAALVFPSAYLQTVFARHGITGTVVPNVVDTTLFRFQPRDPVSPRLVSARLLEPLYAVDNTIRAFALIRNRIPNATLDIYGDGFAKSALQRLVDSLGVEGVCFHGEVPHERMPKVLANAGILVNSSRIDNMPHVLIEGLAAGIPIVTTSPGGIPYIVEEGHTALTVPVDDPEAMAEAVLRLLWEPGLAQRLTQRGREACEQYTWSVAERRWLKIYRKAAGIKQAESR